MNYKFTYPNFESKTEIQKLMLPFFPFALLPDQSQYKNWPAQTPISRLSDDCDVLIKLNTSSCLCICRPSHPLLPWETGVEYNPILKALLTNIGLYSTF